MEKPILRSVTLRTRWPIRVTGPCEAVIEIPVGNGPPILNTSFVEAQHLTDAEYEAAEQAVLREIAVRK